MLVNHCNPEPRAEEKRRAEVSFQTLDLGYYVPRAGFTKPLTSSSTWPLSMLRPVSPALDLKRIGK